MSAGGVQHPMVPIVAGAVNAVVWPAFRTRFYEAWSDRHGPELPVSAYNALEKIFWLLEDMGDQPTQRELADLHVAVVEAADLLAVR